MNPINYSNIPEFIDYDVYDVAYDALKLLKDDLGEGLFDKLASELNARYDGFVYPLTFIPYVPNQFHDYEQTLSFTYYSVLNYLKSGKSIPLLHDRVLPYLKTIDNWQLFSKCTFEFCREHHCIMGFVDRVTLTKCRVASYGRDSWSFDYLQKFYDKGACVTFHRWLKRSAVSWSTDPLTGREIIDENACGEWYHPQYAFFETDEYRGN